MAPDIGTAGRSRWLGSPSRPLCNGEGQQVSVEELWVSQKPACLWVPTGCLVLPPRPRCSSPLRRVGWAREDERQAGRPGFRS